MKKDALDILDYLFQHGANLNRLSYVSYNWPNEQSSFNSFETPLITATRHSNYYLFKLFFF